MKGPRRLRVAKAYKMFIGGAFVRSESGRVFQVKGSQTAATADAGTTNIPLGSRKDVRDAVLAARGAFGPWASRTAYNRGQVLYRLAEVLESRRDELVASLVRGAEKAADAEGEVDGAVDRAVFYAGFCDKVAALLASSNPVAGPHFGFSVPEPMGVVGVVAPERPALLGLLSMVLPALTGGNTVVAVASSVDPRTAVLLCECVATSDVPAGVVNVLTGSGEDLGLQLARHRDVNAVDARLASEAARRAVALEGAGSVKRVHTAAPLTRARLLEDRAGQGLSWVERFVETKTVWHPVGL